MAISIEHMKTLLETVQTDVEKFNNGNMSAGTRVRKAMQEITTKTILFRNCIFIMI